MYSINPTRNRKRRRSNRGDRIFDQHITADRTHVVAYFVYSLVSSLSSPQNSWCQSRGAAAPVVVGRNDVVVPIAIRHVIVVGGQLFRRRDWRRESVLTVRQYGGLVGHIGGRHRVRRLAAERQRDE